MMHAKVFSNTDHATLEEAINHWLKVQKNVEVRTILHYASTVSKGTSEVLMHFAWIYFDLTEPPVLEK